MDYLQERQPGLDYNSLRALAYYLGNRFWKDLELHHPDLDSLHLPVEVAAAWRQRLLTQPKTVMTKDGQKSVVSVPRVSYGQCLTSVRSFYLDLSQWAIEDPARWAHWVVALPRQPGRNRQPQVRTAPQSPHGRPNPRTPPRPSRPGPNGRPSPQDSRGTPACRPASRTRTTPSPPQARR